MTTETLTPPAARAETPALEVAGSAAAAEIAPTEAPETMYPPFPEDARLAELERQLPPPPPGLPPTAGEEHVRFPMWLRVGLIVCAVLLLVVGVAGLFLPGLQGIVTILAGVALLSLVSSNADRFLRWTLGPWPKLLDKVEDARERSRDWLLRLVQRLAHRRGCVPPAE